MSTVAALYYHAGVMREREARARAGAGRGRSGQVPPRMLGQEAGQRTYDDDGMITVSKYSVGRLDGAEAERIAGAA